MNDGTKEKAILLDGAHFFNKRGTGIASYARTLASTLRSLGCSIDILYGRPLRIEKNSSNLALATQIYGETPLTSKLGKIVGSLSLAMRAHLSFSSMVDAREIATTGLDLRSLEPPHPQADHVYNVSQLYEQSSYSYHVKRRLTEVRLGKQAALAHWTSPLAVRVKGCPNVYTIHDLIPLQFPHFVRDRDGRSATLHAAVARQADLIVTVSEASRDSIVNFLKVPADRICVTYQPTPPLPTIARADSEKFVQQLYGVNPGDYAIFVGAIEPKKNLKRLIEAFIISGINIPLLIVGPLGWLYSSDLNLIKSIEGNDKGNAKLIRRLGFLPRSHVTALLQCARFMTFPSICEGFGLPVLEAMQMGVPVLTSNVSSLPEVAGDAAVLVDPLNITDISKGISRLANDPDMRQELIDRGFVQARKFGREHYIKRLHDAYARVGVELPLEIAATAS